MDDTPRILVVDDEEPFRRLLSRELTRKGFLVEVAEEGRQALDMLAERSYDVVLLDIMMPGMDGAAVMRNLRNDPSSPPIIVITGQATVETAVEAMKNGAYDYLTKPYKLDELVILLNRAYEFGRFRLRSAVMEQELVRKESPVSMVASSEGMKNVLALIRKIAPTDSTVLIEGESGTGKELVANTIWTMSSRRDRPIVALNCATLSENLVESEMFGHEKGAFTAAYQTKYGLVEAADGGTLFLDEIGEIPHSLQAKLLRFLDLGEFRRVGGNKTLKTDVRVIAATNKNLAEQVEKGEFREDLYYRLNVISIAVPPLRERLKEIPDLVRHFIDKYGEKTGRPVRDIAPEAVALLAEYTWPGNVRELENVIERAAILCDGGVIQPDDLAIPAPRQPKDDAGTGMLDEVERDHIARVLNETGGNRTRASEILGINRKTLYLKIKKYGLES